MPQILIAGGGTGGHVFPGLAVADAIKQVADCDIVFVGSPRGIEKDVVPKRGYRLEMLDVRPMKGGGIGRALVGAFAAARATIKALSLVSSLRPDAVLSVGGYAAGPISLAAAMRGVPVAILEPNATAGMANRWLSPVSKRAYVAWDDTGLRNAKVLGVPLRAGFEPVPYVASQSRRLLVMGGSLGARAINDVVPHACARADIQGVSIVHQTGRGNDAPVIQAYARLGIDARVVPFLDDVPAELALADVVIARSGAVTVAEIAAMGRCAILIPFPFAADDHQTRNADALAAAGGAVRIAQSEATDTRIADEIAAMFGDEARRVNMASAARAAGRPFAALEIAADLLDLAGIPPRPRKTNGTSQNERAHV